MKNTCGGGQKIELLIGVQTKADKLTDLFTKSENDNLINLLVHLLIWNLTNTKWPAVDNYVYIRSIRDFKNNSRFLFFQVSIGPVF